MAKRLENDWTGYDYDDRFSPWEVTYIFKGWDREGNRVVKELGDRRVLFLPRGQEEDYGMAFRHAQGDQIKATHLEWQRVGAIQNFEDDDFVPAKGEAFVME